MRLAILNRIRRSRLFAAALHHGDIMSDKLKQPLGSVHPIIAAEELCLEKLRIIPGIHTEAGKEIWVAAAMGSADDVGNAVLETLIFQSIAEEAGKVAIFLGKWKGIGERFHGCAEFLFDDFLGVAEFVVNLFGLH